MMKKYTVYIETSVISYYTSRPSRDLVVAAHQQLTHEWWENYLPQVEAYISTLVIQEVEAGDALAAKGSRKNNFTEFAPRFRSDLVATD